MIGLINCAAKIKADRIGAERRKREMEEKRRLWEEREEKRKKEQEKLERLDTEVNAWHKSQKIRA